jgi:hypothetical protein
LAAVQADKIGLWQGKRAFLGRPRQDRLELGVGHDLLDKVMPDWERRKQRLDSAQPLPHNPRKQRKNPAAAGSGERFREGKWRRRRDSNPRDGFPPTPLAGERLRPLGHVSVFAYLSSLVRILRAALIFMCFALPVRAQDIMIVTEEFPPYNYSDNGRAQGLSSEVVQAVLAQAGLTAEFLFLPWARAYLTAQNTKNTLIFSIGQIPEREDLLSGSA